MKTPDWTHFRSAETDPEGPCCLLPGSFPVDELPRNYIWAIGYIGEWKGKEDAEISAQVRSYSREFLLARADTLKKKKEEEKRRIAELDRLQAQRKAQMDRLASKKIMDGDAIKRKVEASPLQMAKGLIKSAGQLATGGVTDPTERMKICDSCPFKGDDKRCGLCGCFLPAKTRVAKSSCPIGLWG